MAVAKDQIRQIITENNITSVADVYSLLKDSFKDILQELLEAEMDATLGYEKNCKGDLKSDNKRNGHSSKTLKSQYGEFQIDVPRDRNGEYIAHGTSLITVMNCWQLRIFLPRVTGQIRVETILFSVCWKKQTRLPKMR